MSSHFEPVPEHRRVIGGLWEEIGLIQFDYLVANGLEPRHYLLDIGCGSLRGGVKFVPFLLPGHYYGIDQDPALLDAGRGELEAIGVADRGAVLTAMSDFGFGCLGRRFDFAIAQSLFTHLALNSIARCLIEADAVLVPGGRLFATFYENDGGPAAVESRTWKADDGFDFQTHFDRDWYHYVVSDFEYLCRRTHFTVQSKGEWGHPRRQRMLVFTKGL